jgi:ectoine hydroxylase-related dioxygenase (phytanoyl-CoA dioxygenase family)
MHRPGGRKRYIRLKDAPAIRRLVTHEFILKQAADIFKTPVRLLEAVSFNKPPEVGGHLMWHHDMSYYPLRDGRLVSAWIPFDQVTPENGAVSYAAGSHRHGDMGAVDLATGSPLLGEDRPLVPNNPASMEYPIETPSLDLGDFVLMDGRVWHGSGPNRSAGKQRRGLAIRYFSEDMRYHPRAGNAATFVRQIRSNPGDPVKGGAFPTLAP